MLRKIIVLGVPLLLIFGMMTTMVVFEGRRTPPWQRSLNQYFTHTDTSSFDLQVYESAKARQPWNFEEDMATPFFNGIDWPWQQERLPFPPDILYCTLIDRIPTTSATATIEAERQLVYVAHHSDALWRVGWMVHEGPVIRSDVNVPQDFTIVGCDLSIH
jgi:hypothetical protein